MTLEGEHRGEGRTCVISQGGQKDTEVPHSDMCVDLSRLLDPSQHPEAAFKVQPFGQPAAEPLCIVQESHNALGGRVWRSSLCLLRHLERTYASLEGMRILELGSGTGVLGIALANAVPPPACVVLTDQACVMELLRHNIAINGCSDVCVAHEVDWTDGAEGKGLRASLGHVGSQGFHLVLAADCVYYQHLFEPLIRVLERVCAVGEDTLVLLCNDDGRTDPMYERATGERWDVESFDMLSRSRLQWVDIPTDGLMPPDDVGGPYRLVKCRLKRLRSG